MARKYSIETFGCQMNVHDSERIAGLLEQAGYEATDDPEAADVVVLNTCSVRERAEDKLYSRLGELRTLGESPGGRPLIAVAGCVAQQEGESILARASHVDVIVGTQASRHLPLLLERAASTGEPQVDLNPYDDVSFPLGIARRSDPVKAYVTILEGCNDYCSFCVVPYTRGHERMRSKAEVLAEVREAVAGGRREVHLLGQIVNHYQAPDDAACDFPALLAAVNDVPGVERIRFASPHPRHASQRFVEAIRDLPHVCKHVHLPVQSGSTRVLQAMRRRHSREEFLDLVGRLRQAMPGLAISTDMIVGFPGETDEDFRDTLTLTEQVGFSSMFSFKYLGAPRHTRGQAPERRRAGGGEGQAAHGIAGPPEGDPVGHPPGRRRTRGRCPGRFEEPPGCHRAGRTHHWKRGGEPPWRARLGGENDRRQGAACRAEQPVGRGDPRLSR